MGRQAACPWWLWLQLFVAVCEGKYRTNTQAALRGVAAQVSVNIVVHYDGLAYIRTGWQDVRSGQSAGQQKRVGLKTPQQGEICSTLNVSVAFILYRPGGGCLGASIGERVLMNAGRDGATQFKVVAGRLHAREAQEWSIYSVRSSPGRRILAVVGVESGR